MYADPSNYQLPDADVSSQVMGTFSSVASELEDAVQRFFCLACCWGLSASMSEIDRQTFSAACAQFFMIPLPSTPLLDMFVSPVDFSWKHWSSRVPFTEIEASKITKDNSLIPTIDTLRHEHLIRSMILSSRSILLCGPPGSGKSMSVSSALSTFPDVIFVHLSFSSSTQPSLIMKTLQHNCVITRTPYGLVMRPHNPANRLVLFCDEVNLPAADAYGTQTAITLLRQILQFGGFWRPHDAAWIRLEHVHIIAACNPASDSGRTALPDRFLRHVMVLHVDFPSRQSIEIIYGSFTRALMRLVPSMRSYAPLLCQAMVELHFRVMGTCTRALHDHYVFSPRDLSRWIRGIFEIVEESDGALSPEELVRFWAHEALRLWVSFTCIFSVFIHSYICYQVR
jgi:dynein heavy chain 1